MTNTVQNIRYVHITDSNNPKYNGFTVAYTRDSEKIVFAWAKCEKNNIYTKSVGREYALETLKSFNYSGEHGVYLDRRIGVIPCNEFNKIAFNNHQALTNLLGDHLTSKLTPRDYKHAFISEVLTAAVSHITGI